jgi:hypothetical protein
MGKDTEKDKNLCKEMRACVDRRLKREKNA